METEGGSDNILRSIFEKSFIPDDINTMLIIGVKGVSYLLSTWGVSLSALMGYPVSFLPLKMRLILNV